MESGPLARLPGSGGSTPPLGADSPAPRFWPGVSASPKPRHFHLGRRSFLPKNTIATSAARTTAATVGLSGDAVVTAIVESHIRPVGAMPSMAAGSAADDGKVSRGRGGGT
jgi:hypothetical protein